MDTKSSNESSVAKDGAQSAEYAKNKQFAKSLIIISSVVAVVLVWKFYFL